MATTDSAERLAAPIADTPARASRLPALVEAMRPWQWAKNVFVLAGIVFAGRLFDVGAVFRVLAAFGIFCAAASAVYLLNDLADRAHDAIHPVKRLRPIASGRLAPGVAVSAALVLIAVALGAAALVGRSLLTVTVVYLALTFAYTFALKNVFLLDVLIIAAGFVLRAVAGAAAIDAHISPWLLVCSFLLAVFLSLGKRRHELTLLGLEAGAHRAALGSYSLALVDSWLTALSGATIVCYALYTQSERTVEHFGTTALVYTVPFVVYGLFRYQHLLVNEAKGGDPGTVLLHDRALRVTVLAWAIAAAIVIYR